jgi:methyl-accepting chemotaxis protein
LLHEQGHQDLWSEILRLSSYSVRTRLGLIVVSALLALALIAGLGLLGLRQASMAAGGIVEKQLPASALIGDLRAGVGQLRRFEKDVILHTGDPKGIESYMPRWEKAMQQSLSTLTRLEELLDTEGRTTTTALRKGLDAYGKGFTDVSARLQRGEFGDATYANQAMEPLKTEIRGLDDKLGKLVLQVSERASAERAGLQAMQKQQILKQLAAVVVVAVAMILLAWQLVRSITGPLARAEQALARLAEGDLSQSVESDGRDELARMMQRLAEAQTALRELVQTIQGNAQSVSTASAQIAAGNADLSARTERQAASLQQTAASMEQLAATVKAGAETARLADGVAKSAHDSAQQGGAVVAQVVQTMAEIQAASRRIADITSVIDGIAFQTNILALNAAVEAARAGEQGRGFAVVASEVRALAQRSSEAAREIKSLIGSSVERVEAGHLLVERAGNTMGEVVSQVRRVTDLMSEISTAVSEQQQGITQVGQAVSELDQATQQNSALVEESAAASDSLRQQAERLTAVASVFKLQTS